MVRLSDAKVIPRSPDILKTIGTRFRFNINRVNALIESARLAGIPGEVGRDILRAAVVLLHATLEDVLRNVLRLGLPYAENKFLEDISFDRSKRITKITVAQLRQHAGKSVDALVEVAVNAHVSQKTFNNTHDVMKIMEPLRLNSADFRGFLSKIGKMMARRHKIVHESDRQDASLDHHGVRNPISAANIQSWVISVKGFVEALLEKVAALKTKQRQKGPD